MKTYRVSIPTLLLAASLLAACNTSSSNSEATSQEAEAESQMAVEPGSRSGKVAETMNSGGYTYVLVNDGSNEFWAAAPEFAVAVGESVIVPASMPMQNYRSNTLERDFDVLYFAQAILVEDGSTATGAPLSLPPGHPDPAEAAAAEFDLTDIAPVNGGITINEIYDRKLALSGQNVSVRGKVVKFNSGIMGTNWIHVQDGSGGDGTNDLTVTTDAIVTVGDTVLITGVLGLDRDLGSGYFYPVIVENATVSVE